MGNAQNMQKVLLGESDSSDSEDEEGMSGMFAVSGKVKDRYKKLAKKRPLTQKMIRKMNARKQLGFPPREVDTCFHGGQKVWRLEKSRGCPTCRKMKRVGTSVRGCEKCELFECLACYKKRDRTFDGQFFSQRELDAMPKAKRAAAKMTVGWQAGIEDCPFVTSSLDGSGELGMEVGHGMNISATGHHNDFFKEEMRKERAERKKKEAEERERQGLPPKKKKKKKKKQEKKQKKVEEAFHVVGDIDRRKRCFDRSVVRIEADIDRNLTACGSGVLISTPNMNHSFIGNDCHVVLTAAHCVSTFDDGIQKPYRCRVKVLKEVPELNTTVDNDGNVVNRLKAVRKYCEDLEPGVDENRFESYDVCAKDIHIYPEYHGSFVFGADIAIIILRKPVHVKTAQLWILDDLRAPEAFKVIGWPGEYERKGLQYEAIDVEAHVGEDKRSGTVANMQRMHQNFLKHGWDMRGRSAEEFNLKGKHPMEILDVMIETTTGGMFDEFDLYDEDRSRSLKYGFHDFKTYNGRTGRVDYTLQTSHGMSGGPLYFIKNSTPFIVGVHVMGGLHDLQGGTLLTETVMEWIMSLPGIAKPEDCSFGKDVEMAIRMGDTTLLKEAVESMNLQGQNIRKNEKLNRYMYYACLSENEDAFAYLLNLGITPNDLCVIDTFRLDYLEHNLKGKIRKTASKPDPNLPTDGLPTDYFENMLKKDRTSFFMAISSKRAMTSEKRKMQLRVLSYLCRKYPQIARSTSVHGSDVYSLYDIIEIIPFFRWPLTNACANGDLEIAKLCIENGHAITDLKVKKPEEEERKFGSRSAFEKPKEIAVENPLNMAVRSGNYDLCKYILRQMSKRKWRSDFDMPQSLATAAKMGYIDIVRLILDTGISVNKNMKTDPEMENCSYSRPIDYVIPNHTKSSIACVKVLIEAKADIHLPVLPASAFEDYEETDWIHCLVTMDRYGASDFIRELHGLQLDVTSKNDEGMNALHFAAYYDKLHFIPLLVELNCDVNARSKFGTPLDMCFLRENVDETDRCVKSLASFMGRDFDLKTYQMMKDWKEIEEEEIDEEEIDEEAPEKEWTGDNDEEEFDPGYAAPAKPEAPESFEDLIQQFSAEAYGATRYGGVTGTQSKKKVTKEEMRAKRLAAMEANKNKKDSDLEKKRDKLGDLDDLQELMSSGAIDSRMLNGVAKMYGVSIGEGEFSDSEKMPYDHEGEIDGARLLLEREQEKLVGDMMGKYQSGSGMRGFGGLGSGGRSMSDSYRSTFRGGMGSYEEDSDEYDSDELIRLIGRPKSRGRSSSNRVSSSSSGGVYRPKSKSVTSKSIGRGPRISGLGSSVNRRGGRSSVPSYRAGGRPRQAGRERQQMRGSGGRVGGSKRGGLERKLTQDELRAKRLAAMGAASKEPSSQPSQPYQYEEQLQTLKGMGFARPDSELKAVLENTNGDINQAMQFLL